MTINDLLNGNEEVYMEVLNRNFKSHIIVSLLTTEKLEYFDLNMKRGAKLIQIGFDLLLLHETRDY